LADDFDANGRKPCPSCGSVVRTYEEHVEETLTVYDSVRWKHKRPGRKKPLAEGMSGYERTVATGRWAEKVSVIDRENNRRIERVVDDLLERVQRSKGRLRSISPLPQTNTHTVGLIKPSKA
jgi:hypothetical protein